MKPLARIIFFFGMLCMSQLYSQDMKSYNGMWSADVHQRILSHDITMHKLSANQWHITMSNDKKFHDSIYTSQDDQQIRIRLDEQTTLKGEQLSNGSLSVFINSTDFEYHILLTNKGDDIYTGRWNTFFIDALQPSKIYLAIEEGDGDSYAAYPLISADRFRGTYVGNFQKVGNLITFSDRRTGYFFKGELEEDKIVIGLYLFGNLVSEIDLKRNTMDFSMGNTALDISGTDPRAPRQNDDGVGVGKLAAFTANSESLDRMEDSIANNALTNVHSVLIAKNGSLIYEHYFNGFHANLPHDQRSAAKSIGSAIVGIALEEGILKDINQSIYDYIPQSF